MIKHTKHYSKLTLYYCAYALRWTLLAVCNGVALVLAVLGEHLTEWKLRKPTIEVEDDVDFYEQAMRSGETYEGARHVHIRKPYSNIKE